MLAVRGVQLPRETLPRPLPRRLPPPHPLPLPPHLALPRRLPPPHPLPLPHHLALPRRLPPPRCSTMAEEENQLVVRGNDGP